MNEEGAVQAKLGSETSEGRPRSPSGEEGWVLEARGALDPHRRLGWVGYLYIHWVSTYIGYVYI